MKKSPLWRIFTAFKISENMRIGQKQSLWHFYWCLFRLENGDLPIAELPDSIHIPPENLCKTQDDSSLLSGNPLGNLSRRHFLTLMHTSILHAYFRATVDLRIVERALPTPKSRYVDQIIAIILHEMLLGEATFCPLLTVQ